jgi:hypothetical protein
VNTSLFTYNKYVEAPLIENLREKVRDINTSDEGKSKSERQRDREIEREWGESEIEKAELRLSTRR